MGPAASTDIVTIPYSQIVNSQADLSQALSHAFGPGGLGVLTISGVPSFEAARARLLPLSPKLAGLPQHTLAQLEDPISQYNIGWSCGKESLVNGQPDTFKGSFYANPCRDGPSEHAQALISTYPQYFRCNLWPSKELPELQPAFLDLAHDCMYRVGLLLAAHCDKYITQQCGVGTGTPLQHVQDMLVSSRNHTARLLHYFPPAAPQATLTAPDPNPAIVTALVTTTSTDSGTDDQQWPIDQDGHKALAGHGQRQSLGGGPKQAKAEMSEHEPVGVGLIKAGTEVERRSVGVQQTGTQTLTVEGAVQDHEQSWCGWHTDHSALTGLTRAMYIDEATGREVACRDPHAGLYVRNRAGSVVKVNIPEGHIAFQVGEALQVLSGGLLRATPHYVRAPQSCLMQGVSRNTLALFMQPDVEAPLCTPPGVPSEAAAVGQWQPGQTFGEFAKATFEGYYQPASTRLHTLHSEVVTAGGGEGPHT